MNWYIPMIIADVYPDIQSSFSCVRVSYFDDYSFTSASAAVSEAASVVAASVAAAVSVTAVVSVGAVVSAVLLPHPASIDAVIVVTHKIVTSFFFICLSSQNNTFI